MKPKNWNFSSLKILRLGLLEFLQPWPAIVRRVLTVRVKAALKGFGASLIVLILVWILVVPHHDLSNRRVISVLVAPDLKVITEGQAYQRKKLPEPCFFTGPIPPNGPINPSSGITCRNWTTTGVATGVMQQWIGERFSFRRYIPREAYGNSRSDAVKQVFRPISVAFPFFQWLLIFFVVIQSGIWMYRRERD
jgi:hypothetical protein